MNFSAADGAPALITRNKDKLTYLLFSFNHSLTFVIDWMKEKEEKDSRREEESLMKKFGRERPIIKVKN